MILSLSLIRSDALWVLQATQESCDHDQGAQTAAAASQPSTCRLWPRHSEHCPRQCSICIAASLIHIMLGVLKRQLLHQHILAFRADHLGRSVASLKHHAASEVIILFEIAQIAVIREKLILKPLQCVPVFRHLIVPNSIFMRQFIAQPHTFTHLNKNAPGYTLHLYLLF